MAAVEESTLRRRVARLGLLSVALVVLTLVLFSLTVEAALEIGSTDKIGRVPVAAKDELPEVSAILAMVSAAAAIFVGLAALHTAAAMRVLAQGPADSTAAVSRVATGADGPALPARFVSGSALQRACRTAEQAAGRGERVWRVAATDGADPRA